MRLKHPAPHSNRLGLLYPPTHPPTHLGKVRDSGNLLALGDLCFSLCLDTSFQALDESMGFLLYRVGGWMS